MEVNENNVVPLHSEVEEPKDQLETNPPYLPAIMGCRSVSEFQCLNKYANFQKY